MDIPEEQTVIDEEDYASGRAYRRDTYADAHYEPVEASTVPPRYYTPPERQSESHASRSRKRSGRTSLLVCAILAAAILGGVAGAMLTGAMQNRRIEELAQRLEAYTGSIGDAAAAASEASDAVPEMTKPLQSQQSTISPSEIYDLATKQVVGVRTEYTVTNFFGMTSSAAVNGTGFLISSDGYILTNYHVVEGAFERHLDVEVISYDGTKYSAAIVGAEPANDLAVLKIDADGMSAAELGNSDLLKVGDAVYAVGNPLGELEFSMTTGYVSALNRVISTDESEAINMFQIDAAVNEGNSGGPVYDSEGRVVGIVTAKYSSTGVEGLGFAIPMNDARTIAWDLITKGYVTGKASIGVRVAPGYNAMYAQYYGLPMGAYVTEVLENSAAEKAGIRSNDIIIAVGEYEVTDYNELKTATRHFSAYDEAELTVYRSGEELRLSIVFDEQRPE
ncbi:MAG: S1C family serine protease [Oscillospiraceae bacterium]|nr:S1C family serine protease [Oscillospiraceae bacterium]